ncbi:heme peroxidase [Ophiocordyceps camponoti-floridani]|uniref:Heme peroxidase n=1 Tax=Ophiocordyceps camponoti-floridani TaxID=2030778 RepID=A0A8H4VH70_9HYPO|nr:heme peroxidase [Ophiocordyceps camponoti-floridani]
MELPNSHHAVVQRSSINPINVLNRLLPWNTLAGILEMVDIVMMKVPMSQYWQMSRRPLPTEMGDGSYRVIKAWPSIIQDLRTLTWQGEYLRTLKDMIMAKLQHEMHVDDKTMIMERTIQLVATMPDHSARQEVLTNMFITKLWNSLDHPPLLYLGDEYRYRQPDGSNNNPMMPMLGAAGTAYSRSVKPGKANLGALPDPEAVYESVMARKHFKKNKNNVSSILWYWATIVIHDIFETNSQNPSINNASSYLDLSPLYGKTKESVDSMRTFKDGKIKPDSFAERRLIAIPPGVCVMLVMFNRFHNYIADNLAEINDTNRFPKPGTDLKGEAASEAWRKYDEDLFQTARLVTSGLYINIMLLDYVRNIVNLNRVDTKWTLDPRQEMGVSAGTEEGAEAGVGNSVSAEFNLLYRWHSCISDADDKWLQKTYQELGGDKEVDLQTMMGIMKKFEKTIPEDPGQRTFGGFARGPEGRFDDEDLVKCITAAIEDPAGSFGAQNVPRVMKPVEILGIIRGRRWNLTGLNAFRKHFGLKAYDTFEEINSDPEVANSLRFLYGHPDHVELYPGVVAEESKEPMVPGVGITPTYTISRVVLSDAISLVRGDRYYTTDYHPGYLTQWGFNEVQYDLDINHGCNFFKLFLRAFPNHFSPNSVYAHYPMVTPAENHKILTHLGRQDEFDFSRPSYKPPPVHVSSYGGVTHVLDDEKYRLGWSKKLAGIVGRPWHGVDSGSNGMMDRLMYKGDWKVPMKSFFARTTSRLIAEKSHKIADQTYCDVVRDVGNLVHTHFVAHLLNLPIKSEKNPRGVFSEQELYQSLATICTAISHDNDPVKTFQLQRTAREMAEKLGTIIEANLKIGSVFGSAGLFTGSPKVDSLAAYGAELLSELSRAGIKKDAITWEHILPTAAALVPNEAQQFAQAVNFYLSPAGQSHIADIHRLATQEPATHEGDALLLGYALEGVRLAGPAGVFRQASSPDVLAEDGRVRKVRPGESVFVSFASVTRDDGRFPNPDTVNPHRPLSSYIHNGAENHSRLSRVALVEMFRALFRKKGLKRAAGPRGELKKIPGPFGYGVYMNEDWGGVSPFPSAMKVTWDE